MSEPTSGTRLFLRQARRDFLHTGAIAPSSRFLARAITSMIGSQRHPMDVLEAGAGTGALTGEILKRLPGGSRFDIYEINPIFSSHLEKRFGGADRVTVINRKVQEIPEISHYDAIVSGLPLNNFEPALVKEILGRLFDALKPGGVLSYFEYLLIREIKSLTTGRVERRRLRKVGRVTGGFLERYEFRRDAVLLNIPPAVVHHLRKPL